MQGVSYGFSQAVIFFADSAAFFTGANFVQSGEMDFETVMKYALFVIGKWRAF